MFELEKNLFYNSNTMSEGFLWIGLDKVDVTPSYPVRLGGYFNERISTGVLDRLYLRLAALSDGESRFLFLQLDNCAVPSKDAEDIRREIARRSEYQKHEIMLFTSHIHTGPDLVGFFGLPREEKYLGELKKTVVETAVRLRPHQPVSISMARAIYEGLAFNRRWVMKDGRVVTNPPKKSPQRLRPEGAVDREVNTIVFKDGQGRFQAVFVNISNHTDAIGGNMISADWPGVMERRLNEWLGTNIPVFLFLAPQGNINHLEFEDERLQSDYQEAERLGRAYAEIVAKSLGDLEPVSLAENPGNQGNLEAREILLRIPPREIPAEEMENARRILSQSEPEQKEKGSSLTAEDLARGDPVVERLFARDLIRFAETRPETYEVPLQAARLGKVAFAAIPGEPFVEIGLELKASPQFKLVFPVALANGYFGYIPLWENFGRGGYETRTGSASCLSKDAADRILAAFRSLLAFSTSGQLSL